ncbi:hypothetical protein STVA_53670 [Allostella vacuolata]|nr:hypothetical protein STVA_53670 [Stella vacuolata]
MRLTVLALLALTAACSMAARAEPPRVDRVPVASSMLRPGVPAVPVQLVAWFSRPQGAGPAPAVLLMHGCSGPGRNLPQWRRVLHELGYAVLSLDSFGGRGVQEICSDFSRVSDEERLADAHAGLDWLAARADVRSDRVALIGFSHGGGIALDVGSVRSRLARPPGAATFVAVVAFYPACRPARRQTAEYAVPVQILIGEADDWTPASRCRELAMRSRGIPVELTVFPGALHGFDVAGLPVALRPDVRNVNRPGGWGSVTGEDPAAREAAETLVKAFLLRQL